MAHRTSYSFDFDRSKRLSLDALFVEAGKGDDTHYFARNTDSGIPICPLCGSWHTKVQDLFSKTYRDIIQYDNRQTLITLDYEFYKYRCLNEYCRHIFAKEIDFASQNDNVTYRLEDEIARRVISGSSYGQVAAQLSDELSRQAVGQIFNRWVHRKDELRRIQSSPSSLAVISGRTDKDNYTLFLNLDDGIRVLDVLNGVHLDDISAELKQLNLADIDTVLTDCNPTISDAVYDNLTDSTYIIPVDYWVKLVTEDFRDYTHDRLRWCTVPRKDETIMRPASQLGPTSSKVDYLLRQRPELRQPYEDYNQLLDMVADREDPWTYKKLDDWSALVCESLQPALDTTFMRLERYKEEIYQHELNRDAVPNRLFQLTEELEKIISGVRTFSPELLRARVLYSVHTDFANWTGVPLEEVIETLRTMINNGGNQL